MTPALRQQAATLGAALPPLLAAAQHLAATLVSGEHGRRRAGAGDAFWQYRAAVPGDPLRRIDWRRSGRGDQPFVRETEWQAAQSVLLWADCGRSMAYASNPRLPSKVDRARLLALALTMVLLRGGERVGLADGRLAPRSGRGRAELLAAALMQDEAADYAAPPTAGLPDRGIVVFLSDFLGDETTIATQIAAATDRGIRGALVQILDPAEVAFPFAGRTIFESIGGTLRHETRRATDLAAAYRTRLAERQDRLADLARRAGWHYHCHTTDQPAAPALLWLYRALERRP